MVQFTSSKIAGLDREQDFDVANVVLDWIRNNWTLQNPAPYDKDTNPFGILFGLDYFGYHDFVAYASNHVGHRPKGMSIGGSLEEETVDISFYFTIRRYNPVAGEQLPPELNIVLNYLEDFIDYNPRGLKSQGIRYVHLDRHNTGEREMYGQQVFQLELVLRCKYYRINC